MHQIVSKWTFDSKFLNNRISLLSGPRQIGKTTLSKLFLKSQNQQANYFNWDSYTVKRKFANNPLFFIEDLPDLSNVADKQFIVFDELHKHVRWKNILKSYYDEFNEQIQFIVCGSAKLDTFRKSGESLIGRYFMFKMFPLGPKDIVEGENFKIEEQWSPEKPPKIFDPENIFKDAVKELYNLTGFPEPFLKGERNFYNRWQKAHISLLTREEIRDLTKISDITRLQILSMLLPERVTSPISIKNLSDTLEAAHSTVKLWLNALENVYLIFSLPPYSNKISRAIKKERKFYFWDWGILKDNGKKFENFIAVQLYRTVTAWNEWGIGYFDLYYLRTKDGKEVDFLITNYNEPIILVEAKYSGKNIDKNLNYFHERLKPLYSFQVIFENDFIKQMKKKLFIIDVYKFLKLLV